MKKAFFAFIISAVAAISCCLTCCASNDSKTSSQDGETSPNASQSSSYAPTRLDAPYDAESLSVVLFTDVQKSFTVDVTANTYLQSVLSSAQYYAPDTDTDTDETTVKYVLALRDISLQFDGDGLITFVAADGATRQAVVKNNEFACLDTLVDGDLFSLDKYTPLYNIKVYDADAEGGAVKDKINFIENLQTLRFVKLNDAERYRVDAPTYTLRLGNDVMLVCPKYVVLNDELLFVCQGNFAFLDGLEYTDDVELPWI